MSGTRQMRGRTIYDIFHLPISIYCTTVYYLLFLRKKTTQNPFDLLCFSDLRDYF
jgi:hypothetical protein